MSTNIAVAGAGGRMGRELISTIAESQNTNLTLATEHNESKYLGLDSGLLVGINSNNIKIQTNLSSNFDVLIDFTKPKATLKNLRYCINNHKKIIIGTTGFTDSEKQLIQKASNTIAIVFAPNMSVGVNLCYKLLEITAQVIGENSDIEIIEAHHHHKVDSPSGTALAMGKVIAKALGTTLEQDGVFTRYGMIGPRKREKIGFATIRGGDIVGEHTAMFADVGERLEITHKASSRATFAKGAVRAASWVSKQNNGIYNMQDVLGF